MKLDEAVDELVSKIQAKNDTVQCFEGTVKDVDIEKGCATITREEQPTLYTVRLNSIVPATDDKFIVYPAVQSKVLCCLVNNNKTEAAILKYSKIDSYEISIGEHSLVLDGEGITFNGGENGGLIIVKELRSQLSKNNEILNKILTVISGSPIPEAGNGAVSALQAALKTALANTSTGDFSGIENTKVSH